MDLEQLFLTRQSTREFSSKAVSEKLLEKICRQATLAPSAINQQPYRLYAVVGEKAKKFAKNIQKDGANAWADSCPAYIVIECLPATVIERGQRKISNAEFIQNDVGILAAYITLAAENEGLQTCIVGLRDEEKIAEFLNLDKNSHFPLIIATGYKAESYPLRKKKRKDFESVFKIVK